MKAVLLPQSMENYARAGNEACSAMRIVMAWILFLQRNVVNYRWAYKGCTLAVSTVENLYCLQLTDVHHPGCRDEHCSA